MSRALMGTVVFASLAATASAGGDAPSTIWSGVKQGLIDSGWVVQFPTGSSDFFDATYTVAPGIGNVENGTVAGGLPITGISVSVADFGSGRTYPKIGIYRSNPASGSQTPDLSQPIVEILSPTLVPPPLFQFVTFDTPEGAIPVGDPFVHVVVQLPPGDSGLLGVGADSGSGSGGSGFSTDGYTTPSIGASFLDFGMNPGQDNSATTSCNPANRAPHGRLRVSHLQQGLGEGDKLTTTIQAGGTIDLAFFGTRPGDKLRFHLASAPCVPAIGFGPVLSTLADPDGDGSYLRVNASWPAGFGGQTFRLSAAWGNAACTSQGAGFTNCITIVTQPDGTFGACDDGTIESGWVVSIPGSSSDYFNNSFGVAPPSVNFVTDLALSILDFGTSVAALPSAGVSLANLIVDPSGNTPDIQNPLCSVAPFTFPPGTFATTSQQYVTQPCAVPASSLTGNVHGWLQLPATSAGLLAIGADTTTSNGCSFFSSDSYQTPAVSFPFGNLGIRLKTN